MLEIRKIVTLREGARNPNTDPILRQLPGLDRWLAISESMGPFATDRTMHAIERLNEAKDILREHGDYDHLTEFGPLDDRGLASFPGSALFGAPGTRVVSR